MTFWSVFESVAVRESARIAVEIQRAQALEQWTYGELHAAAVTHAARLASIGVGTGDRCAILADGDPRWCAAYLGILRIGAIAVPLDPGYTPGQVARILSDTTPRVIFVDERLEPVAREGVACGVACRIEFLGDRDVGPHAAAAPAPPDPTWPAVILYTSGTTADPKGVVLTHANLLAARAAASSTLKISPPDIVLGALPLFHALAQLLTLLLPFAAGARVVFLESLDSTELVRALVHRRITVGVCTPQVANALHRRAMDASARSSIRRRLLKGMLEANFRLRRIGFNVGPLVFRSAHHLVGRQMRLLVTGGARLDPAVRRDFHALGFNVVQAYGLAEVSGAITLSTPDEACLDTVGRALPGNAIRILPSDDQSLDGEVAIRGSIVMQGYFKQPDATAAALKDGWFLTGDLGRLDDRGRLTITGRKLELIAVAAGKNVSPEEIEAQYRRSPFVKEICVVGPDPEDDAATAVPAAVVVPNMDLMRERRIVNAGDLLRFEIDGQSIHLPVHSRVLDYQVWFEPLPRTSTGNLKRHEVLARLRQTRQRNRQHGTHAPTTDHWTGDPHGLTAAAVISRHARGRLVTPDANLELDLGLDSMERVALIAELEACFGMRVPQDRAQSILTVAQLVDAMRRGRAPRPAPAPAESWSLILKDLPEDDDPALASLLLKRRLMPAVFFLTLRLARLVLPRFVVRGREHLPRDGPYILAPNHQSYLDPFFLCSVLPFGIFRQLFLVGASEYFETPLTAWLARQLQLVPVDPDANLVPAMKAAAFGLTHGRILVLFPEGERSIDGTVKRFKKGAPILSRHLDVPIVPVAIRGVFELWPRNRRFNWRLLLPGSGHRVRLAFGAPMRMAGGPSDADSAAALRKQVDAMWDQL